MRVSFSTRAFSLLTIVGMLLGLFGVTHAGAPDAGAAGAIFQSMAQRPGVAVTPSGVHTIYLGLSSAEPAYLKLNGGFTPVESERSLGGGEADSPIPQIAADPLGNVHMVWSMVSRVADGTTYREVFYAKRDPNGAWTGPERVSFNLTGSAFGRPRFNHSSPTVTADVNGTPYVAWQGGESGVDEVYERVRGAGGWGAYSDAKPFCITCGSAVRAINPQYGYSAGGAVHLTFIQGTAPSQAVWYSRRDGDRAFRKVDGQKALQAFATDFNGRLYVAWRDGLNDAAKRIRLSASADLSGASWSTVGAFETIGDQPENARIMGVNGRLHVAWNNSFGSGLVQHAWWKDGLSGSPTDLGVWRYDTVNGNGKHATMGVDGAGNAYIAWTNYSGGSPNGAAIARWNVGTEQIEGGTAPTVPGPSPSPPPPAPPGDCGAFSCFASRGGILTDSPAAASFGGRAFVFARGTDDALYVRSTSDGANYSEWRSLGGILTDAPAATSYGGRVYVFARGTDDALYMKSSPDGFNFDEWILLGGILTAAPAAASADGVLYVFARGTDDQLYVKQSTRGANFGEWDALGGILTAAPAAAGFGGNVYVFAKGSDDALYVRRLTDGRPSTDFIGLGGILTAAPAAAAADGELYVFANGSDNGLYYKTSGSGLNYNEWSALGGSLKPDSTPAAAGVGERIFAFVRWVDDALYERHSPR